MQIKEIPNQEPDEDAFDDSGSDDILDQNDFENVQEHEEDFGDSGS